MSSTSTPTSRKRWRWIAITGTALAMTATGATVASAATSSAPNVRFTKVYYNSPGTDTRSNASLNAEYAQITNRGKTTVTLTGWTIRDKAGHTYKLSGTLPAGRSRIVHTGKGTNGKPGVSRHECGRVWPNLGLSPFWIAAVLVCVWRGGFGGKLIRTAAAERRGTEAARQWV